MMAEERNSWPLLISLGAMFGAWVLWYANPSWSWTLVIPLLPVALAVVTSPAPLRLRLSDILMLGLLGTALIGVWAAYDRDGSLAVFAAPSGWQKLVGLLLGAMFYVALSRISGEEEFALTYMLLAAVGIAVAAWFIWSNDWAVQPSEWPALTALGIRLQSFLPRLPGHQLNANVTAGIVAPLLPLALAMPGLHRALPRYGRIVAVLAVLGAALMALALLFTLSKGGLVAVGAGLGFWLLWALSAKLGTSRRRVVAVVALVAVLAALGVLALSLAPVLRDRIMQSAEISNRANIYSQALLLIRDLPFTGSGLGNFALVHSTYALMIHVPIIPHAHSLLLNLAVEQGVPGAILGAILLIVAAWVGLRGLSRQESLGPILVPALSSLAVVALHGIIDDPLYSSRGVALLWVPAALVFAGATFPTSESRRGGMWWLVALVAIALLAFVVFQRPLRAAWWANLGAVSQARSELPLYDYNKFDSPSLDEIRQGLDTSQAEGYYARSLALSPSQVTANVRLSALAFSRKDYAGALAYARDIAGAEGSAAQLTDREARFVLGDALVANDMVEAGTQVVRGLKDAAGRFQFQAWYKYWRFEDYHRAANAWEAALLLDPSDKASAASLEQARQRLSKP